MIAAVTALPDVTPCHTGVDFGALSLPTSVASIDGRVPFALNRSGVDPPCAPGPLPAPTAEISGFVFAPAFTPRVEPRR